MKLEPELGDVVGLKNIVRARTAEDSDVLGYLMLGIDPNGDTRYIKVDEEGRVLVRIVEG